MSCPKKKRERFRKITAKEEQKRKRLKQKHIDLYTGIFFSAVLAIVIAGVIQVHKTSTENAARRRASLKKIYEGSGLPLTNGQVIDCYNEVLYVYNESFFEYMSYHLHGKSSPEKIPAGTTCFRQNYASPEICFPFLGPGVAQAALLPYMSNQSTATPENGPAATNRFVERLKSVASYCSASL